MGSRREPKRYRRFEIKKKNGKVRVVYAPNKPLKQAQRGLMRGYMKEFKKRIDTKHPEIRDVFHGFVQGRSPTTAAELHRGFECTISLDIINFFDNTHKDLVLKHLPVSAGAQADVFVNDFLVQGFCTSPILANFALIDFIKQFNKFLKANLDKYALTIYADDIQVSLNVSGLETEYVLENSIIEYCCKLIQQFGYEINPKKTRIRYAKYGYRRILGVNVGEDLTFTRKVRRKIRAARHQNNKYSLGGLMRWASIPKPKYPW